MKRFSFPLERVRKWRQDQSEIEEIRLQQIYAELRSLEESRQFLLAEYGESRRELLSQSQMTGQDLASMESLKEYTEEQARRMQVKERVLVARAKEQQARVLEAHRGFQLLDGLKDRALVSWNAALDKEQEELAAELFLAKRVGSRREVRKPGSLEVRNSRSLEVRRLGRREGD